MKMANVVSVQTRDTPGTARVERMTTLLRRYPAIESREEDDLLGFLTGGPPEEIVQVTHLEGLEPRFRAFRADHPREFRTGLRGWLAMILFVAIAALGVAWRLFLY